MVEADDGFAKWKCGGYAQACSKEKIINLTDGIQDFLMPETGDVLKLIERIPAVVERYTLNSDNVSSKVDLFI
jgi:hypothetical protein